MVASLRSNPAISCSHWAKLRAVPAWQGMVVPHERAVAAIKNQKARFIPTVSPSGLFKQIKRLLRRGALKLCEKAKPI